jgi:hypothetical protein
MTLTNTKTGATVSFEKTGRLFTMTNSLGEKLEGLRIADVRARTVKLLGDEGRTLGWRLA